jgi:integrase
VLSRAVLWGMIDVNPARRGADNPSLRRREQRSFESRSELDAVVANLAPRYRPTVIFAAATGLRLAERLVLEKRADVHGRRGGVLGLRLGDSRDGERVRIPQMGDNAELRARRSCCVE